jgi:hypothetical protein
MIKARRLTPITLASLFWPQAWGKTTNFLLDIPLISYTMCSSLYRQRGSRTTLKSGVWLEVQTGGFFSSLESRPCSHRGLRGLLGPTKADPAHCAMCPLDDGQKYWNRGPTHTGILCRTIRYAEASISYVEKECLRTNPSVSCLCFILSDPRELPNPYRKESKVLRHKPVNQLDQDPNQSPGEANLYNVQTIQPNREPVKGATGTVKARPPDKQCQEVRWVTRSKPSSSLSVDS